MSKLKTSADFLNKHNGCDAQFCCFIEQEKIPYSNIIKTILTIESKQIDSDEFRNDLRTLLQNHCS